MAAGIEDVAQRAGVSVATVSRALRGLPNVAAATRQRVEEAAAELHYVAHPHASRLATRRSATIGVLVPSLRSWYHTMVVAGAAAVLSDRGFDLLPYAVDGSEGRKRFLLDLPFRKRVDGLLVVDLPFSHEGLARLESTGVALVSLGIDHGRFPSLTVDNDVGARSAVRHLLTLGHRRIAVIGGPEDPRFVFPIPVERWDGVRAAMAEHDLEIDPELHTPSGLDVRGGFDARGGADAMTRLLALDVPPTAVFALSDEMAIGAIHTARSQGLRVPEDLSVIGFDDHALARYLDLTTVDQAVGVQGEQAIRMLLDLLDPDLPAPSSQRLATRLVLRGTTARRLAI